MVWAPFGQLGATLASLAQARRVWPRCLTLPMGWSYSAYLAQMVHEELLHRAGFSRSNFIAPGNDLRLDRTRIAIYIDDVSFIGHDK